MVDQLWFFTVQLKEVCNLLYKLYLFIASLCVHDNAVSHEYSFMGCLYRRDLHSSCTVTRLASNIKLLCFARSSSLLTLEEMGSNAAH